MKIVFNDSSIVVVDKPSGLLSVPGRGPDKQDCVVSRVKQLFPDMLDQPAVHRLDMYTSGIMVLAQNKESHRHLSKQFEQRKTAKTYIALLDGIIQEDSGRIELKFRLDPKNRPYQIYDPSQGKTGITLWKKLAEENKTTRVEFIPVTGRTHQLRIHAAHSLGLNTPIVGDRLYGTGIEGEKMMLHASSLTFTHPETEQELTFESAPSF